jgi:hypothetical protein
MTVPVAVSTQFLFTHVELIQRLFKLRSLTIKLYVSKIICLALAKFECEESSCLCFSCSFVRVLFIGTMI